MEYASGGELFERICNAGRFSEDEVPIQCIVFVTCSSHDFFLMHIVFGCRHASSSSSLYQEWATVMQWYVKVFCNSPFFFFRNLCSSYRYTKKLTFLVLLFPIKQVCHRDLKLENTLLDGSPAPRLKICDFGYSKVIMQELNKHMHVERHFSKLEHCKIIMWVLNKNMHVERYFSCPCYFLMLRSDFMELCTSFCL